MRIGLCCIPVNKGINFIEAWATKYSDLYEIVHSSFDLVPHTIFICLGKVVVIREAICRCHNKDSTFQSCQSY